MVCTLGLGLEFFSSKRKLKVPMKCQTHRPYREVDKERRDASFSKRIRENRYRVLISQGCMRYIKDIKMEERKLVSWSEVLLCGFEDSRSKRRNETWLIKILCMKGNKLLHVYAKAVGRPSTGNYPASSPDPTTHYYKVEINLYINH